jgi:hypothetical protein
MRTLEDIVLSYVPANPALEGMRLADVAEQRGVSPGKALCDLLLENDLKVGY